jgi:hypothetical protein
MSTRCPTTRPRNHVRPEPERGMKAPISALTIRRSFIGPAVRSSRRTYPTGSPGTSDLTPDPKGTSTMAKNHGPSVKDDKQYEGLREKGMSKERAAQIANTPNASSKGGKNSHKGGSSQSSRSSGPGSGGNRKQKQEAGRKGGKASH